VIDFRGNQEKKAKIFAGMISEVLQKPVRNRQNEFYIDKGKRYFSGSGKSDGSIAS